MRFVDWLLPASSSVEFCIEETVELLCGGSGRERVAVWETVKISLL
jgi:hypothetical protein